MKRKKIWFDSDKIFLEKETGQVYSMQLNWFPKLKNASATIRENYEFSPFGIHWPDIDEDLSFEGFEKFNKEKVSA